MSLFEEEMDETQQLALEFIDTYGLNTVVDIPKLRKESPRLNLAYEIAKQNKFMHWELEFADLFAERGGFDLVVGIISSIISSGIRSKQGKPFFSSQIYLAKAA